MKKNALIIAAAVFFAACGNKKTSLDADKQIVGTDTAGMYKSSILTDKAENADGKTVSNSSDKPAASKADNPPKKNNPEPGNQSTANSGESKTNSGTADSKTAENAKKDKGWSSAAKGTVIGATTGAVVGAVVSKDKAKGAVIGAVIGGGTGYAIGRSKDKKSGRVDRKRAAREAAKQ